MKTIIGIDNGVTGSYGILYTNGTSAFLKTPVVKVSSYTQKEQSLHRVDWRTVVDNLPTDAVAVIERPMVNPRAFVASMSALRALEATIICLEMRDIPYVYIDSKEWQRFFFASSLIGHGDMKEASRTIGAAMFGNHATAINKHKDADGLLIAEYAKRNYDKLKFPKDV